MVDTPTDAVHQILIKIQESIGALRSEMGQFRQDNQAEHERMGMRFDQIETLIRKQRRAAAGMLVMMRATAGEFDERVSDVEERLTALETKSS